MNRYGAGALLLLLLSGTVACQKASQMESSGYAAADAAAAPQSPRAKGDSGGAPDELAAMLAYEHSATVAMEADAIPARMQQARNACEARKFGACVVLNVQQSGGDFPSASLSMRLAPAGVEPMIALASDGARLGSRSTHAEDLAVVVRDNSLVQDRLRKELARLQEFQQRPDLAVADMITLSQRMAEAEAQLQAAEQEGAQHRRRIDTQLLSLNFQPTGGEEGRNEVVQAFRDFGKILSMGTAWMIRAAAFLIPLLLVLVVLAAGMRRWNKRK